MTFLEFLATLAECGDGDAVSLSMPVTLATIEADRQAARVLQELDRRIESDTTLREGEQILMYNALSAMRDGIGSGEETWYTDEARAYLYAWWWLVFWGAYRPGGQYGKGQHGGEQSPAANADKGES